jgi:hypothetical protein
MIEKWSADKKLYTIYIIQHVCLLLLVSALATFIYGEFVLSGYGIILDFGPKTTVIF